MFVGNSKILEYFDTAIEEGTLAHTYCFVGPDGVGKRTLARILAAKLLQVSEDSLGNNPDYYYLERVEDEKTGKLKKEISVAQAREMRSRLQRRGWLGGYQVVVVNEVELLNEESANALLKILEEPGEQSVIFLLTENDRRLLPTIRSRSQLFYFSLVSDSELRAGLVALGYPTARIEPVLSLAWGRPGRARQLLDDAEFLQTEQAERARWQKLLGAPLYEKGKMLEEFFGAKDDHEDHIRGRERLDRLLELWTILWRERLIEGKGVAVQEIIDGLGKARKLLRQNIHPRLVVEEAIMRF